MAGRITDFETREVVLRADFDLLDEDNCAWVSTRFMHGPECPSEGDLVYLLDGHGRGCVGTVVRIEGWYACVRPDFDSFVGSRPASVSGGGRNRSLQ